MFIKPQTALHHLNVMMVAESKMPEKVEYIHRALGLWDNFEKE